MFHSALGLKAASVCASVTLRFGKERRMRAAPSLPVSAVYKSQLPVAVQDWLELSRRHFFQYHIIKR